MPVAQQFRQMAQVLADVTKNVDTLNYYGADSRDINFLKNFLTDSVVNTLVQTEQQLEHASLRPPIDREGQPLLAAVARQEVLDTLQTHNSSNNTYNLYNVLNSPHMKALLQAYDDVAGRTYAQQDVNFSLPDDDLDAGDSVSMRGGGQRSQSVAGLSGIFGDSYETVRMIGVRKVDDEPLGITVRQEQLRDTEEQMIDVLIVARILAGSTVDKQGLLHVGDIIREVDGTEVSTPQDLQDILMRATSSVTMKVLTRFEHPESRTEVFVRTHFSYDPLLDNLIPSQEAGLAFEEGEILQIVDMSDPSWWQARKVEDRSAAGLIPSQAVEERRKAWVRPEYDMHRPSWACGLGLRKKRKQLYTASQTNNELEQLDLQIYEEVARKAPTLRRVLVLVGAAGVGRRTLKNKLIRKDPSRFASVTPHTSRASHDGRDPEGYIHEVREKMEEDIAVGEYVEWGEYKGNLYGIKAASVRSVLRSGKMCILDINADSVKRLRVKEFAPYVVFIAAPAPGVLMGMHEQAIIDGVADKAYTDEDFYRTVDQSTRLERRYKHQFDQIIVNDNTDVCFHNLYMLIKQLVSEPQWVPVEWVY